MNILKKIIEVFRTEIYLPEEPPEHEVYGYGKPRKEQKWVREELPDFMLNLPIDKSTGTVKLVTKEQIDFAEEEVRRCKQGFFLFINGIVTYLTGNHYFYLKYWWLEDAIPPDYRDVDRRYFLFYKFWKSISWCLGIVRGKKRREGASSQATSNLVYEVIFLKNTKAGLVSKSNTDSRDTFTEMVSHGYKNLPAFLKPKQINNVDSVTEILVAHPPTKQGEAIAESKVTYRPPVLNAYDRSRLSAALFDEFGKLEADVPADQLFAIVKKTLTKGVKRVGFCEMPSTVNSWKKGGAPFKKIWDGADQFNKIGNVTANRLVKYLSPAYDGYEGFIGEFGESVIDAPTEEQYEYLVNKWVEYDEHTGEVTSELTPEDIRLGAKQYVLVKRRAGLTGTDLEEEIRQNPCDEDEMFMAANADCSFDGYAIGQRLKVLKENPVPKRSLIFYEDKDNPEIVRWRDIHKSEENFHWKLTWGLTLEQDEINKRKREGLFWTPDNIMDGAIAVDSYSNTQGGRKYGSKASAILGRRFDVLDPSNSGKPFGHLYGRPAEKDELHLQVLLAARYFGYKVWYEHTADDYYGFFKDRGFLNYLGAYPLNLIPEEKRDEAERHKGTPITGFSLTKQMDYAVAYFKHYSHLIDFEVILETALIFDPTKRTEFDTMVSFLIWLAVIQAPVYVPKPPPQPLVQTYGGSERIKTGNPAMADF